MIVSFALMLIFEACILSPKDWDKDQDGILFVDDCDDTLPNDRDCDGVLAADDCDDLDASTIYDMDCDGIPVEEDCDDLDASTLNDMDCDGVLAEHDCDDHSANIISSPMSDYDGDGIPCFDDCDDFDAVIVSQISVDPECDLFFVASNNVTIVCPDVMVGEVGYVGDVQYTKRDKEALESMRQRGDWIGLSTSCTSDITDMAALFGNAQPLEMDITHWDVSSVRDMSWMFASSSFDQDIGNWDTSEVVTMDYMFQSASSFNQDLSNWCVSNISSVPIGFSSGTTSWTQPQPDWGTCP
ncbi:MAG: BspA family leucine-rich repeat surface protein [Myxococcota bacterium]|nr:BspA family leucine-rich repeat surface protein [Myxococcota bacterium]